MIRPILIHPDPRLKKLCAPVAEITAELRQLAADMLDTMYAAHGVGLAAPQVGVLQRLIVMDCSKEFLKSMVLFNPVVAWASKYVSTHKEGCLSIPGHYADVRRPAEVTVRWTDLRGVARVNHFTGLGAACVQHEIDHLDGKLFIEMTGDASAIDPAQNANKPGIAK